MNMVQELEKAIRKDLPRLSPNSEILLSDVLEWFSNREKTRFHYFGDKVELIHTIEIPSSDFSIDIVQKSCSYELLKPRLADQSKELIEFLYNLK